MNIFLVLKSLLLDKFIAMFIRLSSKEGHIKLLKSGDHEGTLTSLIGFTLIPSGDNLTVLYLS